MFHDNGLGHSDLTRKMSYPRFLLTQRHLDCRRRASSPVLFPAFMLLFARFAFVALSQKCLASPPSSLSSAFLSISGLADPWHRVFQPSALLRFASLRDGARFC